MISHPSRPHRRWRRQRGSATVQFLLGMLPLIALLLMVALGFRLTVAHADVAAAAAAAARAASLERHPTAAQATATTTAALALQDKQVTCNPMQVTPDISTFTAGGAVTVTVTCTVNVQDLTGLAIPGQVTVTGTSTSPVDTWRATTGGVS